MSQVQNNIAIHNEKMPKAERDLLLLAQTGILNFEQMQLTGFHGESREAYRVAINKLKEKKYVATYMYEGRKMAICLAPKGKEVVKNFLENNESKILAGQINKAQPSIKSQQFIHRLNTNTFYCSYLSAPSASIGEKWLLEYPYDAKKPVYGEGCNRSDGYLETTQGMRYFVEQDNHTQRTTVIFDKVNKYLHANVFSSDSSFENNILVFCIDIKLSEKMERNIQNQVQSHLYQKSIKLLKIWKLLEYFNNTKLLLGDIIDFLQDEDNKEIRDCLLTEKDEMEIRSAFSAKREFSFSEFEKEKEKLCSERASEPKRTAALDDAFERRVKNQYRELLNCPGNELLLTKFLLGMRLYVLPLHDIKAQQPHLMVLEFQMVRVYEKVLTCMGLVSMKNAFFLLSSIGSNEYAFWFRNVFVWENLYVIWEDVNADIGAYYRLSNFMKNGKKAEIGRSVIFVLLIKDKKEAVSFYQEYEQDILYFRNISVIFSFFIKDQRVFQNLMLSPFMLRREYGVIKTKTVFVEAIGERLQIFWEDEAV